MVVDALWQNMMWAGCSILEAGMSVLRDALCMVRERWVRGD